jgi:hypothetical protein
LTASPATVLVQPVVRTPKATATQSASTDTGLVMAGV